LELPDDFLTDNTLPKEEHRQFVAKSDIPSNQIVYAQKEEPKEEYIGGTDGFRIADATPKRGRPKKKESFKGSGKGSSAYVQPIQTGPRVIQFIGEGAESDRVHNNPQLKILYGTQKHRSNTSRKTELVDVICSSCGREDSIAPILAVGYNEDSSENTYRCNKCCTSGGR
jgi:hypothetical protein